MGYEGHAVLIPDRAEREAKTGAGDGTAGARSRQPSAATSCRPAEPAPTTSTPRPPRSRRARTRSWTANTAGSVCPFARALAIAATVIHVNDRWCGRRLRTEGDGHGSRQSRRSTTPTCCSAPTSTSRSPRTAARTSAIGCWSGPRTSTRRSRTTTACTSPTAPAWARRRRHVARRPARLGRVAPELTAVR